MGGVVKVISKVFGGSSKPKGPSQAEIQAQVRAEQEKIDYERKTAQNNAYNARMEQSKTGLAGTVLGGSSNSKVQKKKLLGE